MTDHDITYTTDSLHGDSIYKAECSCGIGLGGKREQVEALIAEHLEHFGASIADQD